jgi:hypothetical protein
VKEAAPGIYSFSMFNNDFCNRLLAELSHYEAKAASLGLPVRRPNSMNNYGVIVNDIGFAPLITSLYTHYLKSMMTLLFPNNYGNDINSHHSFMVILSKP